MPSLLDSIVTAGGFLAEAILVLLLARERVYKTLPAFFLYICWSMANDLGFLCLKTFYPTLVTYRLYEIQMGLDAVMIFAILVELAWSVLSPIQASLPKHAWIGIAALILIAAAVLWPIVGLTLPANLSAEGRLFVREQQIPATLRVIVFCAMAGFSQLLGIGWRSRELQVASGLGFYAIVSLAVSVMHTHQAPGSPQYHLLDQVGGAGYLLALTYWVAAFATKEAERQKFSPQMANFLLLIGGSAKASRVALTDFSVTKSRFKDH